MKRSDIFYAKILLFGEYTVMFGSKVLSIPFTHYQGSLRFLNSENYTDYAYARKSNANLRDFQEYLLKSDEAITSLFDLERFDKDLKSGLYFESSIPQGYGIGSSGALVAAFYGQYAFRPLRRIAHLPQKEMTEIKQLFSFLESHFHGKSSGIDPLNAYFAQPLIIENDQINRTRIPRPSDFDKGAIFLVNTGRTGKTGPLVTRFLENYEKPEYQKRINDELIPVNNNCVQYLVNGELKDFYNELRSLSRLQLELFQEMIPDGFAELWQKGLDEDTYRLKLLGSGGGGYLLGFTGNYAKVSRQFEDAGLEVVPVYEQSRN